MEESKTKKDPLFAGFLSFLLAGLGQFYNKDWFKGIVFLGGSISISLLLTVLIVLAILTPDGIRISTPVLMVLSLFFIWGYSIIEAAKRAKEINEGEEKGTLSLLPLILIELILLIALVLIIEIIIFHPPDLKGAIKSGIMRRL